MNIGRKGGVMDGGQLIHWILSLVSLELLLQTSRSKTLSKQVRLQNNQVDNFISP